MHKAFTSVMATAIQNDDHNLGPRFYVQQLAFVYLAPYLPTTPGEIKRLQWKKERRKRKAKVRDEREIQPFPSPPSAYGGSATTWPTPVSRRNSRTALVALSSLNIHLAKDGVGIVARLPCTVECYLCCMIGHTIRPLRWQSAIRLHAVDADSSLRR